MVNLIVLDADGHKVGRRITSGEEYKAIRNTDSNKQNFAAARAGNNNAKRRLKQFNYNAQLSDGFLAGCDVMASTFSVDIDCRDKNECNEIADRILKSKELLDLRELSVSPNYGLHAVCRRQPGKTILENQINFAMATRTEIDTNAHDLQRILFTGPADEDTLLYLDDDIFEEPLSVEEGQEEYRRMKEREEQRMEQLPAGYKKGEKHYRPWEQADESTINTQSPSGDAGMDSTNPLPSEKTVMQPFPQQQVFGHPVVDFINTMLPDGAPKGLRHNTMLHLANDIIILLDNNEQLVKQTLLQLPWVMDVVRERGEKEIDNIVDSAKKLLKKRESENFYTIRPSKSMVTAIEQLTRKSYKQLTDGFSKTSGSSQIDDEMTEMLKRMGERAKKLSTYFPMMKLMFHGHKPIHYMPVLFVGGGFSTTLMTRSWYSFYPMPGKKCRLNSLIMVIGRPASGKHFAVNLYDLLMEPIKKADKQQIDALNQWNAEREKNNGASKSSTARPTFIYRCLPAETTAAAIREAEFNAKETIDGDEWPLHVSIFDSELNNTLDQMKKSYMDAFKTLWLKSFHNENGGALMKTSSSPVGEFPIHFNAVYTGTLDAFAKIATESTYSSGIASRFACVPMASSKYEMMEFRDYTQKDQQVEQQLREWAYKLDAAKGEIPTAALSKALHKWTSRKMEEAKEEHSDVLNDMCRRPAWVGINLALPFIISRHWAEMVQDEDGKFHCGVGFHLDKKDIDLALFIAQAQYDFQQYFFYELGQKVLDKQAAIASGRKLPSRTKLAYMRLPEVFTSSDVMREYGYDNHNSVNSCLKRLQDDGKAKKIRSGQDKGKYRKLE